jgi:hypothetical protein
MSFIPSGESPSFTSGPETQAAPPQFWSTGNLEGRNLVVQKQNEQIQKIEGIFTQSQELDNNWSLDHDKRVENKFNLINSCLDTSPEYTISHFARFHLSQFDSTSFDIYCKHFVKHFPGSFLSHLDQFIPRTSDQQGRSIVLDAIWQMSQSLPRYEMEAYLENEGLKEVLEMYSHDEVMLRNLFYTCVAKNKLPDLMHQISPDFKDGIMQALSPLKSDASKQLVFDIYTSSIPPDVNQRINQRNLDFLRKWLPLAIEKTGTDNQRKLDQLFNVGLVGTFSTLDEVTFVSAYLKDITEIFLKSSPDPFLTRVPQGKKYSIFTLIEGKEREDFVEKMALINPAKFCSHWYGYTKYCWDFPPSFHLKIAKIFAEKAPEEFIKNLANMRISESDLEELVLQLAESHPYQTLKTLFTDAIPEAIRDRVILSLLFQSNFWGNKENVKAIFKEEDGVELFFKFFKSEQMKTNASPQKISEFLVSISKNLIEDVKPAGALTALEKNQIRSLVNPRNIETILSSDPENVSAAQSTIKRLGIGYKNLFLFHQLLSQTKEENAKQEENFFLKHGVQGYNSWKNFSKDAFDLFAFVYETKPEKIQKEIPSDLKHPMEKFAFGCLFPLIKEKNKENAAKLALFMKNLEKPKGSHENLRNFLHLMSYLKARHGLDQEELGRLMHLFLVNPENAFVLTNRFNAAFRILEAEHSSHELREMMRNINDIDKWISPVFDHFSKIFDLDDSEEVRQQISDKIFSKWRSPGLLVQYLNQSHRTEDQKVFFKRWVKSLLTEESYKKHRYGGEQNENAKHFSHLTQENREIWKKNQTKEPKELSFLPEKIKEERSEALKKVKVKFTDDAETLFMIGEDARSCQAVSGEAPQNYGLLATCFSGKNKLTVTIKDDSDLYSHRFRPSLCFKTSKEGELQDPAIWLLKESSKGISNEDDHLERILEFALILEIAEEMGISVITDSFSKEIQLFRDENLVEVKDNVQGDSCFSAPELPPEYYPLSNPGVKYQEIIPKKKS